MQNRYFGDIGDFGKYSLLRQLSGVVGAGIVLGVNWYLFKDESHNNDGRHISYLDRVGFRSLDAELFDFLREAVKLGKRRISVIEQSGILPSATKFFSDYINITGNRQERKLHRKEWFNSALRELEGCELIFLDPDNGLQTPSIVMDHIKSGKFVFWDELVELLNRRQSVLLYQHLNRTATIQAQIIILEEKMRPILPKDFKLAKLIYRRGSCRSYWLLARNDIHEHALRQIRGMLASGWQGHFELV